MGAPWRMRLCFYEGVVGYLTTAVNTFAAPLPPLVMMFWYPDHIRPWHVLPLLAPLWLWHVLLPRISRTRWRVEVIRANVLTSVAAATAFWHTLRGRSAAWVPTGVRSKGSSGSMARRVVGVSLVWLVLSNGAAAGGLALVVARNGWEPAWGLGLYLLVQLQINVPLIRDLLTELRPDGRAPAEVVDVESPAGHRSRTGPRTRPRAGVLPRRWPEALAASAVLLLTGLLASGWVDPMLPWLS
jgi:cellulose synthase (UDP-forming)